MAVYGISFYHGLMLSHGGVSRHPGSLEIRAGALKRLQPYNFAVDDDGRGSLSSIIPPSLIFTPGAEPPV